VNHGELEDGEIPEALKYDRPFELTTLANGVRVASEYWPGPLSTVGVLIEAGSRHETMANAGTAHFLEHLNFKGTKRRTRIDIERGTEDFGGNLNAFTAREMTLYQLQVFAGDEERALDTISDMIMHSNHTAEAVELEKAVILQEA
jgi:predicted Zn-dependent peptidase